MLLMTKIKNGVKKECNGNCKYEFKLSNININGAKRGCCGMIRNLENDVVVYIDTEGLSWLGQKHKNLVRYAKNMNDYGGSHSHNEWSDDENIYNKIISMLENQDRYNKWKHCLC